MNFKCTKSTQKILYILYTYIGKNGEENQEKSVECGEKKASVEIMASNMISICWNEPSQKRADYIKSDAIKIC